ncbi:helix-turn-helix domain-containing protein [Microbacterium sp. W4I20]|uniref:helix-turn-helix domain-containing protein n=1 Tax=Microbacterium sp. W4I20 TaxID=3042262 RepID=UPI002780EA1F|nr:helix-turn-helix domain-containing protein [Microbacterium sp. W4I20]MDQ0726707.1 AraC family transcriptional regulator of arabinose operon [Microbacterium sp. W4I20]
MALIQPQESMHPPVERVSAGYFREGSDYATWRSTGTSDYLLVHTVEGRGRFGTTGDDLLVGPGDAVLLPPGVLHDYGTDLDAGVWEFGFAHFRPRTDWVSLIDWPLRDGLGLLQTSGEVHTRVNSALLRSARMRQSTLLHAELFAVNAVEEALLWLDTQNTLSSRTDERILRVMEFIAGNVAGLLDVTQLASVSHLSVSRFTHLFTEHVGLSPQRYVERERMLAAQQLLNLTNRTVASIARDTGWTDPLYFSQRFHRFTGLSPSKYRKQGRR